MTAVGSAMGTAVEWTLRDAAEWLRPAMSEDQLRRIAQQLPGFRPIGTRPTKGRPADVYDAADVIELHSAVRRWL